MNRLLEAVNRYRVKCEGCDHYYQSAVVDERQVLLHARVDPVRLEDAKLPTSKCRLSYDYVRFEPCEHCCPEVFAACPEAHTGDPGEPTDRRCSS